MEKFLPKKPKKPKEESIIVNQREEVIIENHTKWIAKTYPELNPLGVQVLNYLHNFRSPFPRTIWSMANFLYKTESEISEQVELLVKEAKYKIRKVAWNNGFAYEVKEVK